MKITKHTTGTPCWADLMTADPDKARSFYAGLFDWNFEIGGPESGGYSMARLGTNEICGLSGKPPGMEQMPSVWTVYLAVDDVDATLAKIKEAGGSVTMGPMDVMGQGKMAVVADPTGGMFGLWQPLAFSGAKIVKEPGSLTYAELNTRDLPKARDFFVKVFGLTAKKMEAPGMTYETLHAGDKTSFGILQMDANWPATVPPHWMSYFEVADTDATIAKLKQLGGHECVPAFDTPYGRMAVVDDGLGGTFSVIEPTELAKQS